MDFIEAEAPAKHPRSPVELKLVRLKLQNFKGIRGFDLDCAGGNVDVYGDNAAGKTTLFDAFTWLLFDKDSANRKDFDIKTLGPDGQPEHGLEHGVEGAFEIGGKVLTLSKTYKEQWTKKRGSAEREFTGHTTEYHIDGVPVRKGDYDARVAQIIDEKAFRLLSDPAYFNEQLHWQERRKLLLEVCGDIADRAVIDSDPQLAGLAEILGDRKLDDHRKALTAARAKLNKELEQIPVRISEVQRGLPDIQGHDPKAATARLHSARAARQKKLEELALIQNGGEVAQKRQRLSEVKTAILDVEAAARAERDEALSKKRAELQKARDAVAAAESNVSRRTADIEDVEARSKRLGEELEALRSRFKAVSAETFSYADETACPTCGQALPAEMVEDARRTAEELFNADRAARLERLDAEGKTLRARKDDVDAKLDEFRRELTKLRAVRDNLKVQVASLEAETTDMAEMHLVIDHPDYDRLVVERDSLTAAIEMLQSANGEADTTGLRAEIAALEAEVAAAEQAISQADQYARGLARIQELKNQEKALAAEYERLERELYLTEEFVRVKVRLLTDRINSRFEHARFKLFNVLVNGAVEECCETLYGGVPYGTALNRGARLNVGLDIINTLTEHYGFAAPIWVDNAEAVTRLIPVRSQLIRLVVSEPDKTLRVEVA